MSPALPAGLEQAFRFAVGELGMCSAAWLFTREVAGAGGDEAVGELRDRVGRAFPVLDAITSQWLSGTRAATVDPAPALAACAGASRVLIVGIESAFLDAFVPALGEARVALVKRSVFQVDWDRVLANYHPRLELVDLDSFQAWSGSKSVLLTFVYGLTAGGATHVLPSWMRVYGDDVRTQFRSMIGWDVLRAPMYVYPRWLVETPAGGFTHLV